MVINSLTGTKDLWKCIKAPMLTNEQPVNKKGLTVLLVDL